MTKTKTFVNLDHPAFDMWIARALEMEWRWEVAEEKDKPARLRAFESACIFAAQTNIWSPAIEGYRQALKLAHQRDMKKSKKS